MSMHNLPLAHYSDEPIVGPLRFAPQHVPTDYVSSHSKPDGLWVSVDDGEGWQEWCRSEGFNLYKLAVRHEIRLAPDANILWLRSGLEIDAFTREYGEPPTIGNSPAIRWSRVADNYQGIIIAPYQWSRRLDVTWYYGWDCSSGCIWGPSAIADVSVQESIAT